MNIPVTVIHIYSKSNILNQMAFMKLTKSLGYSSLKISASIHMRQLSQCCETTRRGLVAGSRVCGEKILLITKISDGPLRISHCNCP